MTGGRDPGLRPEATFVVTYPGGSVMVAAHTAREAEGLVREAWPAGHLRHSEPAGKLTAHRLTADQVHECYHQGVRLLVPADGRDVG